MKLVVLTKPPYNYFFSIEMIKYFFKDTFKRTRGPQAVVKSLIDGLDELNFKYSVNPIMERIKHDDVVWVHDSKKALEYAIKLKKKKRFKALLVGPSLGINLKKTLESLSSKEIDVIFQPSKWAYDFYVGINKDIKDKIVIWPAGVSLPEINNSRKTTDILIYDKNPSDKNLLSEIKEFLSKSNISFTVLVYGKYSQKEYYESLRNVKAAIFLSNSESQGIALQEAWSYDVPTLVWNRGFMENSDYRWRDKKISAPYLSESTGEFFSNFKELENTFDDFWNNLNKFSPRDYVLNNLSNKISAEIFLEVVNKHKE